MIPAGKKKIKIKNRPNAAKQNDLLAERDKSFAAASGCYGRVFFFFFYLLEN